MPVVETGRAAVGPCAGRGLQPAAQPGSDCFTGCSAREPRFSGSRMAGPENQIATKGHPNPVPRGPGVSLGTGKHRYIFMDVSRLPGPRAARAVACSSSLSLARLGVKPCPAGRSAEGSFICVGRAQARASEDAGGFWLVCCLDPASGPARAVETLAPVRSLTPGGQDHCPFAICCSSVTWVVLGWPWAFGTNGCFSGGAGGASGSWARPPAGARFWPLQTGLTRLPGVRTERGVAPDVLVAPGSRRRSRADVHGAPLPKVPGRVCGGCRSRVALPSRLQTRLRPGALPTSNVSFLVLDLRVRDDCQVENLLEKEVIFPCSTCFEDAAFPCKWSTSGCLQCSSGDEFSGGARRQNKGFRAFPSWLSHSEPD